MVERLSESAAGVSERSSRRPGRLPGTGVAWLTKPKRPRLKIIADHPQKWRPLSERAGSPKIEDYLRKAAVRQRPRRGEKLGAGMSLKLKMRVELPCIA